MDKLWGAKQFSWGFWSHAADVADQIKSVLAINSPLERNIQALALYAKIHSDRSEAFSGMGLGVADPRSMLWITINRWGLLGPLEVAANPSRPMAHIPPALAKKI